jgi:small basic protein
VAHYKLTFKGMRTLNVIMMVVIGFVLLVSAPYLGTDSSFDIGFITILVFGIVFFLNYQEIKRLTK